MWWVGQIHKMARAISNEARALDNERIGGLDFWAPNIKYVPTALSVSCLLPPSLGPATVVVECKLTR
jgi:hypothetical protein